MFESISEFIKKTYPNLEIGKNGNVDKYFSVKQEYDLFIHGAGLRDVSDLKIWKLVGPDSVDFLQRISTNDVKSTLPSHIKTTIFTNEKGRILDRTFFVNKGSEFLLFGSRKDDLLFHWLDKYLIMEEIKIEDVTAHYYSLEIIGPQSSSFLVSLFGKEIENITDYSILSIEFSNYQIEVLKLFRIDDEPVYRMNIPMDFAQEFLGEILGNHSVFEVNLVGEKAYNAFRIKNGLPDAPNELNDNFNPHELNILADVNFKKGCYIGQEVIARLDTYDKVQKFLKGVIIHTDNGNLVNSSDLYDVSGNMVGKLTSYSDSELFDKKIGLAIIRKQFMENGTKLRLGKDGDSSVCVTDLPIKV
ncbi:MAG: hypothetical protein K9G44_00990 [Melioribacteraceae bacterium]|nr:hypothetical protein [Melioribacteraceae bacterium]